MKSIYYIGIALALIIIAVIIIVVSTRKKHNQFTPTIKPTTTITLRPTTTPTPVTLRPTTTIPPGPAVGVNANTWPVFQNDPSILTSKYPLSLLDSGSGPYYLNCHTGTDASWILPITSYDDKSIVISTSLPGGERLYFQNVTEGQVLILTTTPSSWRSYIDPQSDSNNNSVYIMITNGVNTFTIQQTFGGGLAKAALRQNANTALSLFKTSSLSPDSPWYTYNELVPLL